jgi:hypothetical protein
MTNALSEKESALIDSWATSARSSAKPSSEQFVAGNQNDRYNGFHERPDRKSAVPEGEETRVKQIVFG